jgi:uncharacterized protein YsxB (DUF464 family)
MVSVALFRTDGLIHAVEVRGHAGLRRPAGVLGRLFRGSDRFGNILCAAVSVLCYHLANGLERIEGLEVAVEDRSGLFRLVLKNAADAVKSAKHFENFLLTLEDLVRRYPDGIGIRQEDDHVT